jgi:hypothetical protein
MPFNRSVWSGSPVSTIVERQPRRVKSILSCVYVQFCASSMMT